MILSLSHIASEARKRLHLCERYLPHRHKLSPKNFPEWRPYNRISKGDCFFQEHHPELLLNKIFSVVVFFSVLSWRPSKFLFKKSVEVFYNILCHATSHKRLSVNICQFYFTNEPEVGDILGKHKN